MRCLCFVGSFHKKTAYLYGEATLDRTDFDYDFPERLILAPNKGLLRGDDLIDDHAHGKGQDLFEGQLILFGSEDFPD